MTGSLHRLLAGIVDFAGTFPPARLSLEETVGRYIEYRRGPHAWMLGRLVCSVEQLNELAGLLNSALRWQVERPLPISLVIGRSEDPLDAAAYLHRDANIIVGFRGDAADLAKIEAVELRLAHHDLASLSLVAPMLVDLIPPPNDDAQVFFELPAGAAWPQEAKILFAYLEQSRRPLSGPTFGFKLRTGGLDAAAFPPIERVAQTIVACRNAGSCWKATAGLHHPFYHRYEPLGVMMHGILNVACATVLAAVHRLDVAQVEMILRESSPDGFVFDEEGFRWNDLAATNEQITANRREGFVSFGSCSFNEPVEYLEELGLI